MQPARELDQDGVADDVAVHVVDLLEVVGVEHQQAAARRVRGERLGDDLGEVAAVERAGQLVGARAQLGRARLLGSARLHSAMLGAARSRAAGAR